MGTRTYTRSDELNYIDYKTIKITSTKIKRKKNDGKLVEGSIQHSKGPGWLYATGWFK